MLKKETQKKHHKATKTMHVAHGKALTQCEGALDWHTYKLTEKEASIRKLQRKIQHKTFEMLTHKMEPKSVKKEGRKECAGNRSKAQSKEHSVCEGKAVHREYDMKDCTDTTYQTIFCLQLHTRLLAMQPNTLSLQF